EELLLHLLILFGLRFGDRGLRPLPRLLRGDDQPSLRDALVTQSDLLRAGCLIERLPLAPSPGWLDHLLRALQGLRKTGKKEPTGQIGGIGCRRDLGISNQIPGGCTRFARRDQRRTALLEDAILRGIAVPTL